MADPIQDAVRAWLDPANGISQDQLQETVTGLVLAREKAPDNDIDDARIAAVVGYVDQLEAKRRQIAQAPAGQKPALRAELRTMIVDLRKKIVRFSLRQADADPPDSVDPDMIAKTLAFQNAIEVAKTRGAAFSLIAQYRSEVRAAIAGL